MVKRRTPTNHSRTSYGLVNVTVMSGGELSTCTSTFRMCTSSRTNSRIRFSSVGEMDARRAAVPTVRHNVNWSRTIIADCTTSQMARRTSGKTRANSTVDCPGSALLDIGAGNDVVDHEVEQLTDSTGTTTLRCPRDDEQCDDTDTQQDECIFGGGLTRFEARTRLQGFTDESGAMMCTTSGVKESIRNEGNTQTTSGTLAFTDMRRMCARDSSARRVR